MANGSLTSNLGLSPNMELNGSPPETEARRPAVGLSLPSPFMPSPLLETEARRPPPMVRLVRAARGAPKSKPTSISGSAVEVAVPAASEAPKPWKGNSGKVEKC